MNSHTPTPPSGEDRRGFFRQAAAVFLGGLTALVPLAAGLLTLLDPLRRKAGISGFVHVTSLSALPEDGTPRRFPVIADRVDAWNKFPRVPIGAVYLRRSGPLVHALNVTCPHAGCPVEYRSANETFLCPCHNSKFKPDGGLADVGSPSPRGMDTLEVELRNGTEVWVKFQNFEAGKAKKIAVA